MTSYHSPSVLHGMSLVHFIRCHITVPDLRHITQDELSGTNLLAPMTVRWERETEPFLGFVFLGFCRRPSCLYPSSQSGLVTQTFASLSILCASALVILRVWVRHALPLYLSYNVALSGTLFGKKTRLSLQLWLHFGSQMPLYSFMVCTYFFGFPLRRLLNYLVSCRHISRALDWWGLCIWSYLAHQNLYLLHVWQRPRSARINDFWCLALEGNP
jgi:hypothetical protein